MLDFGGRFCSIALARGGRFVLVKTSSQLVSVDADLFKGVQQTAFPAKNGGSMHGLAVAADGATAYVTGGKDRLFVVDVAANGTFKFSGEINLADAGEADQSAGRGVDARRTAGRRGPFHRQRCCRRQPGHRQDRGPRAGGRLSLWRRHLEGRPLGVRLELRRPPAGQGREDARTSAGTAVAVDARSIPLDAARSA